MKIDASFLHPGYQSEQKEGFYAEFDADGNLTHFGYYQNGKPQGWALYLEAATYRGRAECQREFSAEQNEWELGDYSSERRSSEADLFRFWVEDQIRDIYDQANFTLRCSFCGKTQAEVKKLIAGPQVYICDECIQLCNEILTEEAMYPTTQE